MKYSHDESVYLHYISFGMEKKKVANLYLQTQHKKHEGAQCIDVRPGS